MLNSVCWIFQLPISDATKESGYGGKLGRQRAHETETFAAIQVSLAVCGQLGGICLEMFYYSISDVHIFSQKKRKKTMWVRARINSWKEMLYKKCFNDSDVNYTVHLTALTELSLFARSFVRSFGLYGCAFSCTDHTRSRCRTGQKGERPNKSGSGYTH